MDGGGGGGGGGGGYGGGDGGGGNNNNQSLSRVKLHVWMCLLTFCVSFCLDVRWV